MAKPTRTFTGQEGQRATGSAGPDPIRRDFDAIFAMFNPEATLPTGEAGGIDASENMKAVQLDPNHVPEENTGKIPMILSGIVNRIGAIVGGIDWKTTPPTTIFGLHNSVSNVQIDQNTPPMEDTGNLQQVVSWLANRIRAITGKSDWKMDPAVSLQDITDLASHEDISFHSAAKSGVHGVGDRFVAKTSRSDQWPSWDDLRDKPSTFPVGPHQHSANDIVSGQFPPERISNLPAGKVTSGQFHQDRIPGMPASKITSGVMSQARLPSASTSEKGIVQLTSSRSSSSSSLGLTASAMNAHRTSADHDGRYYTKNQIDQMFGSGIGISMLHTATGSSSSREFSVHRYAFASPNRSGSAQSTRDGVEIGFRDGGTSLASRMWSKTSVAGVITWDYVTNSGNPVMWAKSAPDGDILEVWEAEDPPDDEFPGACPLSDTDLPTGGFVVPIDIPHENLIKKILSMCDDCPSVPSWVSISRYRGHETPKKLIESMAHAQFSSRRLPVPDDIRDVLSIQDDHTRFWYLQLWMRQVSRVLFDHTSSTLIPLLEKSFRVNKKGRLELK